MPGKAKRLYWDANVFIHYIEATPAYIATLDELFEQAEKNKVEILTSILSIAEVAFHAEERRRNHLDAAIEVKIDLLREDRSVINLIEVNQWHLRPETLSAI